MTLVCHDCGAKTRKPAIDIGLSVFCPKCAPRHGMYAGEHNRSTEYAVWLYRAGRAQKEDRNA